MALLIFWILFAIGFSFLCSILEAVLLSITPSYIAAQPDGGGIKKSLLDFKKDIDKPLSAILTLNTIAHTIGAVMVGAQADKVFESGFSIGPLSLEMIVATLMTLAILIFSEIIPKTIGANSWRTLVPFTVRSIKLLLFVLAPLVWVSQLITGMFKKDKEMSVLSRSDFRALTTAGEQSGALKADESITIRNLLRLDQITVSSIMTPRAVMQTADEGDTLKTFYDEHQPFRFSRIPIFDERRENIIGILLKDELLKALYENHGDEPVSKYLRKPILVEQTASLSELQSLLMKGKTHIAIVADEYGAILGLVTMEDLFETILGLEIVDETDDVEDLQKLARQMWEKRASTSGLQGAE